MITPHRFTTTAYYQTLQIAVLIFVGSPLQALATGPTVTLTTGQIGANQVTVTLKSSATGRGYFTLLAGTDAAPGTATQTVAGQDSAGAAAVRFGTMQLSADVAGVYTVRNLTAAMAYTVCATADDGTTLQPSVSHLTFTTASAAELTGGAWETVGSRRFSGGTGDAPSLVFAPDGTLLVGYADGRASFFRATVMKYNAEGWSLVGASGFSPGQAWSPRLVLAPDGTPYVSFTDRANSSKATVMKFDGSTWVFVGSAGFSTGMAEAPSLVFGPDTTPYLAFQDGGNGGPVTVMKYTGGTWSLVGGAGMSEGEASTPRLAFSPDGTLYLAYRDGAHDEKATVQRFAGGSWQQVGSTGLSAGMALTPTIAFSPSGTLWIAYEDAANSYKATVMTFNGAHWTAVGPAGFSAGPVLNTELAFGPDGAAYLAYRDSGNGEKATVMKYDGGGWGAVGTAGFSTGITFSVPLAFAPDGTPYVAYSDSYGADYPITVAKLTAPSSVVNVAVPASSIYDADALLRFTVTCSNPVVVAGTPRIALTFDNSVEFATFQSTDGRVLTFVYRVQPGDNAANGIKVGTVIDLNGGSITSPSGNPALLALNHVETTAGVKVVTSTPTLSPVTTGQLGANQVQLTFQSSAAGTGYFTLLKGADLPSGSNAQVRAGQNSMGTEAYRFGSLLLAANTPSTCLVRNLTAATDYTVCFTSDHDQAVVKASFVTAAAPAFSNSAWIQSAQLPSDAASRQSLEFAPDGTAIVAYRTSDYQIKATQLRGGAWSTIGSSLGQGVAITPRFAPDGTLHVAFSDSDHQSKATVRKFAGGEWSTVGLPGFSVGAAESLTLAFAPDGAPYVAYSDMRGVSSLDFTDGAVSVMRFNGEQWLPVGQAGFSSDYVASYPSLAFGADGAPYVSYCRLGDMGFVKRFSGSEWSSVGGWFAADGVTSPVLGFDPDGVAYVSLLAGWSGPPKVVKFSDGAWSGVGIAGPENPGFYPPSLAFGPEGAPYIINAGSSGDKVAVARFVDGSWKQVGVPIPSGDEGSPKPKFAPDGSLYVLSQWALLKLVPTSAVTSVEVPAAGTYAADSLLNFAVNFDRPVTVSVQGGSPSISLTIGNSTVKATYQSGSGGTRLVFSYRVKQADFAPHGIGLDSAIVLNGGEISDASTSAAAILALRGAPATDAINVVTRPTTDSYAGTYFGIFPNNHGRWALRVESDYRAVYIAHLAQRNSAIVVHLTINATGGFTATDTEIVPLSAAGLVAARSLDGAAGRHTNALASSFILTGQISAGNVYGQLDGLNETFSGAVDRTVGSTSSGFYLAVALNTATGATYTIIAPSGQSLIVATTSTVIDDALAGIGGNGQLTATTSGGRQLTLTVNSSSHSITVSLSSAGSTIPVTFAGLAEGITSTSRVVNISTRAYCDTGNAVTIGGFVISGDASKRVLIRAVGPTLAAQGIGPSEVLADPVVEIHDAIHGNSIIGTNDNWGDNVNATEISTTAAAIGASALLGSDTKSAALLTTLSPGVYSFVIKGKGSASGIVLLEVYDVDSEATGNKFVNISSRAYSTSGNGVTIGGFVVSGNAPKKILIRAVGPTLATQGLGVSEVLSDPMIELHDAIHGNAVIATNDNWGDNANAATITTDGARIGATPLATSDAKSAALLLFLQPGVYSFIASGHGGTPGIVLVEAYDAD